MWTLVLQGAEATYYCRALIPEIILCLLRVGQINLNLHKQDVNIHVLLPFHWNQAFGKVYRLLCSLCGLVCVFGSTINAFFAIVEI
jgi:hypothetical protein